MWAHVHEALNQAMTKVMNNVLEFLPGLLALLIIMFITTGFAFIVRFVIRRVLKGIHFDARVDRANLPALAEWSPAHSPTLLMGRLGFWTVMVLGMLVAVSALDARFTSSFVLRLLDYLPHFVAAVLVMIVGMLIARFLARSVLITAVNMQIQSARLLSLGVKWLVMVLTISIALDHLGIGGAIIQVSAAILFGGIVLTLALAVGLGSKEMVSRSWERQGEKTESEPAEHFHHL
jgi:hypothetical protein